MSLTGEQRERLSGLAEARQERRREREIARIKAQMSGEMIEGFADKYEFADEAVSQRLKTLLNALPTDGIGQCWRIFAEQIQRLTTTTLL